VFRSWYLPEFLKVKALEFLEIRAHNAHAHHVLAHVSSCQDRSTRCHKHVSSHKSKTYLVDLHENEKIVAMEVHLVSRTDYSRDRFDNRITRQFFVISNRWSDGELCVKMD
jgi:hypothetical protein